MPSSLYCPNKLLSDTTVHDSISFEIWLVWYQIRQSKWLFIYHLTNWSVLFLCAVYRLWLKVIRIRRFAESTWCFVRTSTVNQLKTKKNLWNITKFTFPGYFDRFLESIRSSYPWEGLRKFNFEDKRKVLTLRLPKDAVATPSWFFPVTPKR